VGRNQRLILDSLLLGVVGGLSAQLFTLLLHGSEVFFLGLLAAYQPPGLPEEGGVLRQIIGTHGLWLIPVSTTLGGLISGLLVFRLAPEAEGHGTDAAVKAYHRSGGFIRYRVPGVKMIASAITIGSGGAAGREGPIALISAGVGSIYAGLLRYSEDERRLLVLIGMAAGLSAIFRSPLGCAVFAVEVLYRDVEYESGALFYTILASLVAYVVNGLFVGWQPLFQVPQGLSVTTLQAHGWYLLLGLAGGLVATLIPVIFYGMRDAFHALPLPPYVKPAIGGLGVGLLALALPQVLGGGYGWIQEAIDGRLAASLLLILLFGKILAFSLTVSSGGSGGIFAPCLFVGAMLGGFLAKMFGQPSAAFVIVGIVVVFGAAARVPFATLLMVAEMTGGYQLLVPAAMALTVSCSIQVTLSQRLRYKSLYEAQVLNRADSPAHHVEHVRIALSLLRNKQIPPSAKIEHLNLVELLESGIPVDLPEGRRLDILDLSHNSPLIGKRVSAECIVGIAGNAEVIAVIRKGHVFLPESRHILKPDDKLLLMDWPPT